MSTRSRDGTHICEWTGVGGGEVIEDSGVENQPEHDDGNDPPEVFRSVPLGSESLGLSGKRDLVSMNDADSPPEAVPLDTKRGRVPNNPKSPWEPGQVQLMAQGLLFREHGYRCDHGILYFAGSRTRVDVPYDDALEARTLKLVREAHHAAMARQLPLPLDDSPKCNGCSLSGICLPDETLALRQVPSDAAAPYG